MYKGTSSDNSSSDPRKHKGTRLATTALVVSIPGIVFFPFAIAAIVLASMARDRINCAVGNVPGRRATLTASILGYLGIFVTCLATSIVILGHARRSARGMKSTIQLRGVVQSLFRYSSDNNEYGPGLDDKGQPVDLTVEGRFKILLDSNQFSPEYIISPAETKTAWTTGPYTTDNYSFTMLDISEDNDRRSEWRTSGNFGAILLSDRNSGTSASTSDIMSIHTNSPGSWSGQLARGDGSASFNVVYLYSTQYGQSPGYDHDHIFEEASGDDAAMIYSGK